MRTTLLLLLLLSSFAYAQNDSIRTSYSTEDSKWSSAEMKRFIRYITRADVEEKTLIKIGFWPSSEAGNNSLINQAFSIGGSFEIVAERKISPSFSAYMGASFTAYYATAKRYLLNPQYFASSIIRPFADQQLSNSIMPKVGTRYYYGMAEKIRQGKSANNFSGNYIGLQASLLAANVDRYRYYDAFSWAASTGRENNRNVGDVGLYLHWGFQRRLGRLGYVDFNAGPLLKKQITIDRNKTSFTTDVYLKKPEPISLSLQVNAFIGLGW